MSGLAHRKRPASGEPSLRDRLSPRALIAHGRQDPVEVGFGRRAGGMLTGAGIEVTYREFDGAHQIDPDLLPEAGRRSDTRGSVVHVSCVQ